MGTNYYIATNKCDCCKRYDRKYHIGKSSYGWAFSFQGYEDEKLTSWNQWKEYIKTINNSTDSNREYIIDEYGDIIECDEFITMIETVKSPSYVREDGRKNLVHNEEALKRSWYEPTLLGYDWDDADGYSFTSREFS
jgi:hypothetical protein